MKKQQKKQRVQKPKPAPRMVLLDQNTVLTMDLLTYTVYSAPAGAALAQTVNINTSLITTAYTNFAAQVSNLFNEYRCETITVTVTGVPNVAHAGIFTPGGYFAPFWGNNPPALTISGITTLPKHRVLALDGKPRKLVCHRQNTPEDMTYTNTALALPIHFGVVGYVGFAAPTATAVYMLVQTKYRISVRSRKI